MNIGQDQALRSIALTIPSSIRAEVNLLNMAFFLLSIQLLVRNSHLKRWTRPMSSDLIVKLLFSVAEPAHSTRRIARGVENIADNSRDLLF